MSKKTPQGPANRKTLKPILLPVLTILILVSGCAESQRPLVISGKTTAGISILEFKPEKDRLRGGESINIMLRVQNTGDALASGMNATIVRYGDMAITELTPAITDIEPPDESFNSPGGVSEILWTITTKPTDTPKTQDVTARVRFDYQSETSKELPVLSSSRARELYQSNKAPQAGIYTNSYAPIRIDIQAKDPIELGEGETSGWFTFKAYLTNQGGGGAETVKATATGLCAAEKIDCIDSVTISSVTQDRITCEGATVLTPQSVRVDDVKLWQGKDATINCKLNADVGSSGEKQTVIKATANYTYHYDTNTAILIEPKR